MQAWENLKSFFIDLHNKTILFKIGNYIFVTYGTLVALGAFAGLSITLYYDLLVGMNINQMVSLYVFILLPAIFIGVRLFSIIEILIDKRIFTFTRENLVRLIFAPGFNIQGGILIGFATIILYAKLTQIAVLPIFDGCALGIALSESIGRIGCHTYGCCWGKPTNNGFGIAYRNPNAKVIRLKPNLAYVHLHPVQIYSAFTAFLLFLFLFWLIPYIHHDGLLAAIFLILHGVIRMFLDKFRDDPRGLIFNTVLLSTLTAGLEIMLGILLWIISISYAPNHTLLTNEHWTFIYTQPSIVIKIIIFTVVAGLYFGSHYTKVGTWIDTDEN